MNEIRLEWRQRKGSALHAARDFLDFIVDGQALSEKIDGDLVSPLGWLGQAEAEHALDRFLLLAKPDIPSGRVSFYICPECGELECGAVGAFVEQVGEVVVWRDFAWVNCASEADNVEPIPEIGPFNFNALAYEHVFRTYEGSSTVG